MRKRFLFALVLVSSFALADTLLKDEGSTIGPVLSLNCVGPEITCTRSGNTGVVTVVATAPLFTSTTTDGGNGVAIPMGTRIDFGAGVNDYATGDGGVITFWGGIATPLGATLGSLTVTGVGTVNGNLVAAGNSHVSASRIDGGNVNSTLQRFGFNSETYDTLGEYSPTTMAFTATHAGYYAIKSQYAAIGRDDAGTFLNGDQLSLLVLVNGVTAVMSSSNVNAADPLTRFVAIDATIHLAAADVVTVVGYTDGGYVFNTLVSPYSNFLTIDQIP